jgi:hypothetical protein
MAKLIAICYLEADRGRDVEILLPLIYYAEKYLDIKVRFEFIYDVYAIYRHKPDLVILPNTIGSHLYYQIAKYAYDNNIKVFALISEGNFRTDGTFDYWGYNKSKNYFQEYICLWTKRTYDFLSKKEPKFRPKMVVTGGIGFDRYKIHKFQNKEEFFKQYNLSGYKYVVGYAGWAFGKLYSEQGRCELIQNGFPEKWFPWLEEQRCKLENILKTTIENNPDVFFILKQHPNEFNPSIVGDHKNEIIALRDYKNTLYLNKNENISDLISISDLWTGFETTTCIESWLVGKKHTIFINPDPDFSRTNVYKGNVIVRDYESLQKMIDEFKQKQIVESCFSSHLEKEREGIIRDTIGFNDGLNHLRAGYYLGKTVQNINSVKKVKFNLNHFKKYLLMEIGKYFYIKKIFAKLPKFKKTIWIFDNYKLKNLEKVKSRYYSYFDDFYKKNGLDKKISNKSIWKELKL